MNIWWCNQGQCWAGERSAGVVCCAEAQNTASETFRAKTMKCVKQDDIIIHYVTTHNCSVLAVSRAKVNSRQQVICLAKYGVAKPCSYGNNPGWIFETDYHDFETPIHRDKISDAIIKMNLMDSPILPSGRVRQAYFMPFDVRGLLVLRQASDDVWPEWADNVLIGIKSFK